MRGLNVQLKNLLLLQKNFGTSILRMLILLSILKHDRIKSATET